MEEIEKDIHPQVKLLLSLPQPVQLSEEWFQARSGSISASSAAVLLPKIDSICDSYIKFFKLENTFVKNGRSCNPYADRDDYINEKATGSRKFTGNIATYHGQKYEPISTSVYGRKYKKEVLEFGLITHPTIPWIKASPDGITTEGIMVEIKNPFRRVITGVAPLYYYVQCQLQLEVCNLEFCDFFETEFVEYISLLEFLNDELDFQEIEEKGLFFQISSIPDNFETRVYVYPEDDIVELQDLLKWKDDKYDYYQNMYSTKTVTVIYWKLITVSCVRIPRDREWFKAALPYLEAGHREIAERKTNLSKTVFV